MLNVCPAIPGYWSSGSQNFHSKWEVPKYLAQATSSHQLWWHFCFTAICRRRTEASKFENCLLGSSWASNRRKFWENLSCQKKYSLWSSRKQWILIQVDSKKYVPHWMIIQEISLSGFFVVMMKFLQCVRCYCMAQSQVEIVRFQFEKELFTKKLSRGKRVWVSARGGSKMSDSRYKIMASWAHP